MSLPQNLGSLILIQMGENVSHAAGIRIEYDPTLQGTYASYTLALANNESAYVIVYGPSTTLGLLMQGIDSDSNLPGTSCILDTGSVSDAELNTLAASVTATDTLPAPQGAYMDAAAVLADSSYNVDLTQQGSVVQFADGAWGAVSQAPWVTETYSINWTATVVMPSVITVGGSSYNDIGDLVFTYSSNLNPASILGGIWFLGSNSIPANTVTASLETEENLGYEIARVAFGENATLGQLIAAMEGLLSAANGEVGGATLNGVSSDSLGQDVLNIPLMVSENGQTMVLAIDDQTRIEWNSSQTVSWTVYGDNAQDGGDNAQDGGDNAQDGGDNAQDDGADDDQNLTHLVC